MTLKLERGVAFPTCVSVNYIMGHYSPMKDESTTLAEGDVAKIDLGAHMDGYVDQAPPPSTGLTPYSSQTLAISSVTLELVPASLMVLWAA